MVKQGLTSVIDAASKNAQGTIINVAELAKGLVYPQCPTYQ